MPIPNTKEELLAAVKTNYEKLKADLLLIPVKYTCEKLLEGHARGTRMSVCDLLAYLNGWGKLVLKWTKQKDAGAPVDLPETGYKWNELGKLAQKFYEDHKNKSYEDLLQEFDNTVNSITKMIGKKTNKQLYGEAWYETYTLGRMIQLNTSSPYQNARARLRPLKKKFK